MLQINLCFTACDALPEMAFKFLETFFDTGVFAEILLQLYFLVDKLKGLAECWVCLVSQQWFLSPVHMVA